MYKPANIREFITPAIHKKPTYSEVNGRTVKTFAEVGTLRGKFKQKGTAEITANGLTVINDKTSFITWFKKDLEAKDILNIYSELKNNCIMQIIIKEDNLTITYDLTSKGGDEITAEEVLIGAYDIIGRVFSQTAVIKAYYRTDPDIMDLRPENDGFLKYAKKNNYYSDEELE